MINILCVCGNGMGTSTILKINIKKICDKHGIDASVESCAFGEALSYLPNTDLVITSPEWSSMLPPSNAVLAQTKNLIDTDGVEQTLLEAVKEHFPDELKGYNSGILRYRLIWCVIWMKLNKYEKIFR